jgi:hypothetical protein
MPLNYYFRVEIDDSSESSQASLQGRVERKAAEIEQRLESVWGSCFCGSFEVSCHKYARSGEIYRHQSDIKDVQRELPALEAFYTLSVQPSGVFADPVIDAFASASGALDGVRRSSLGTKRNYAVSLIPTSTETAKREGHSFELAVLECAENFPGFMEQYTASLPQRPHGPGDAQKNLWQIRMTRSASIFEYRIEVEKDALGPLFSREGNPPFRVGHSRPEEACHRSTWGASCDHLQRSDLFIAVIRMILTYERPRESGRASSLFIELEIPSPEQGTSSGAGQKCDDISPAPRLCADGSLEHRFLKAFIDSVLPTRLVEYQSTLQLCSLRRKFARVLLDLKIVDGSHELPPDVGRPTPLRIAMCWQMLFS